MDYDALIDTETWDFIRRTRETYPDDPAGRTLEEERAAYDAMCAVFRAPRPDVVDVQDVTARDVPVRVYSAGAPSRTVVYFHGGGFVVGGLDSHDDVCAEICVQTGYRVVAVDYRLAPEHKHPAAFDDAYAATCWAETEFGDPIILAGDSAGGNLAAAVAQHARGRLTCIMGQVLIYPGLGGDVDAGSYIEHADAPLLQRVYLVQYAGVRAEDGKAPTSDATYAPLQGIDFSNLPPTIVFSAECDPVRDDGQVYCDRIRASGGKAHWICEQGLVHGYLRARRTVARAQDSFERIVVAIEALGQEVWPYD
ncbi:alpha/beta hydrolase [Sedimentitalea todarodis]|uniref:Alpha/beta hydrolase n=1 Tax=Sedimentitalea todarodis TaxID=1631240 RepID=A0ABU3V8M8_9RHOB|nr:alpha/beta hydrolase [Sedimentitalea todarodis]MDU9002522.1 alpha/beta hydrolase [Sedimentitalea todarodis]